MGYQSHGFPEWYKYLLYILFDGWKHLEHTVEVALILFYNQTYFRRFKAIFLAFCGGKRTCSLEYLHKRTSWMIQYVIYNPCIVCKHLKVTIDVALILFYSLTYLCFGVSEHHFWRSGVVNTLIHGVSIPRPFLSDIRILYLYNLMCSNTWEP